MKQDKSLLFVLILLIFNTFESKCQVVIPGSFQFLDKLTDTTALGFYESIKIYDSHQRILDPFAKVSFNSTYPRGYNDGPVWKGKGTTLELHGGITGK